MPVRSYQMLSDHDFELLVADLLGAEDGVRYEVFARGADAGVDLRYLTAFGPAVVQCKHMLGSTYSQLLAAAKKEKLKLDALTPAPASYRFVTTQPLTAHGKAQIAAALAPWITAEDQVLGTDDLEGLLNDHPRVERAHLKLWLGSAAQLDAHLHAATWERSRQLNADIRAALPLYVENTAFGDARNRLRTERVLVISGPPGIGKTTLARMLLADAALDGYQPIEISTDIDEGDAVINDHDSRVFYYDDFLGSTFLQERLARTRISVSHRSCAAARADQTTCSCSRPASTSCLRPRAGTRRSTVPGCR